ncbi:hypothetical protein T07_573 [Trichinella nelsoni]|uniref:Uncharacterized protein n=1 Tax=Trichinella nelsoni TaxID=6336 RepID=A0A0V0RTE5_9BILA|nr:hypothetical protein T07_573 [Trichinella nelsoni]
MAISIVSKLLFFLTPEDGVVTLPADCSLDSNVMGCTVLRLLQKDDEGMPGQSAITSHGLIQSEFDSSSNFAAEMGSRSASEILPDIIFTKCMQILKALHFSIVHYKITPITLLKFDEIAYRYATFICTFNAIVLRTYLFYLDGDDQMDTNVFDNGTLKSLPLITFALCYTKLNCPWAEGKIHLILHCFIDSCRTLIFCIPVYFGILLSSTDSFTQLERQTYHLVTGVTGTASLLWNEKKLQILTQI